MKFYWQKAFVLFPDVPVSDFFPLETKKQMLNDFSPTLVCVFRPLPISDS